MRILIMVHNLTGGGAERAAALWAEGFVKRGHEVGVVLNSSKEDPITYSVPECVNLYNIYNLTIFQCVNKIFDKLSRKIGFDFLYIKELRSILMRSCPDVVIGVMHPWAEWAYLACHNRSFSIINTEHSSFERPSASPMPSYIRKRKFEWNKHYDHVTILTEADRKCVEGILTNVTVLPNPLAYTPVSIIPHKEKVILAAGRLESWNKGFDTLVRAWGKVAKSFPEWKLEIAGQDGKNSQAHLQKIADSFDLGHQITFLGFRDDILALYRRSSIFVLSSRNEGFGMVLIEAMSQGCACIACDFRGRQREIITSEDQGLICPVDDENEMANSITKMINNDTFRENIQKCAVERSRYYSLDNIMNRWDVILNKIVNKKK